MSDEHQADLQNGQAEPTASEVMPAVQPSDRPEAALTPVPPRSVLLESDGNTNNIDKIRDILFGRELRNSEQKMAHIEGLLFDESKRLQDNMLRRFADLERYMQQEIESLTQQLKAERDARQKAVEQLANTQQQSSHSLEQHLTQLETQLHEGDRQLRKQLLEQSQTLSEELRQKATDLTNLIDGEVLERKTASQQDRLNLAHFFGDLSNRLTQ